MILFFQIKCFPMGTPDGHFHLEGLKELEDVKSMGFDLQSEWGRQIDCLTYSPQVCKRSFN